MEPGTRLVTQLARIRDLDREIFHFTGLEERMLPMQRFREILGHLAGARPPVFALEGEQAARPESLSLGLQRMLGDGASTQTPGPLTSIHQAALLQATELIFKYLESEADIDVSVYPLINHLQVDTAQLLAVDTALLSSADHPLRRLWEILLRICRLFDGHSGNRAGQLLNSLASIVEGLGIDGAVGNAEIEDAIDKLVEVFEQHNSESAELARKLIAGEQGACLQENARQVVNRAIYRAVEGLRLPKLFALFLERVWSKYLYVTYLRNGTDSRQWATGTKVIRLLADSLHIRGRDTMFHYYGTHIPAALRTLSDAAYSIHQERDLTASLLRELDAIHQRILNEEPLDTAQWIEIRSANPANISQAAPEPSPPINALLVGHWYKLDHEGQLRRCKLIEKNLEHGYCLFTNLSGIRVAKLGYAVVDDLLQHRRLRRMDAVPALEKALAYAARELGRQIPGLEQQARDAEQAWTDARQKARRQAAAERLRREQEQRRLEEEARRREQLRHEEERRRTLAEAETKAREAARRRLVDNELEKVERMQSGGWLELIQDNNRRISCKLGLRLKSSGKMIFVDSLGRKVAELPARELAEKIVDGNAAILDYGVAFDNTLGGLINERSEQIYRDEPD